MYPIVDVNGPHYKRPLQGARKNKKTRTCIGPGLLSCGRYWDRTSDLFRVREARYRCANRPRFSDCESEVATGFEPVYTALQAVASPLGHATVLVAPETPTDGH